MKILVIAVDGIKCSKEAEIKEEKMNGKLIVVVAKKDKSGCPRTL